MLAFALLLLFARSRSNAQDTGYISGTVTDKSGAAIASATVVIANASGSSTQTTTTNTDGAFVVAGLPGGTYNLTVTATGFQKYTANGVVLNVGSKIRVDVPLTVGSVSEEIVVTGESVAQVETTSAALGTTITGKQINQLELNGRNFTQLVTLTPGVVSQTNQDEGTVGINGNVQYSINGGRTEYNNWELDGGDNMDNGSNATLNVYPNIEAIAEFKVLTSNYGAQYGRNGSGTIEVETKSGGKTFHGSAFEYLRNDLFNARTGNRARIRPRRKPLTRRTISATPSADRFLSRTTTIPTGTRRSSSGRRNGAARRIRQRCCRTCLRTPSAAATSPIFVQTVRRR